MRAKHLKSGCVPPTKMVRVGTANECLAKNLRAIRCSLDGKAARRTARCAQTDGSAALGPAKSVFRIECLVRMKESMVSNNSGSIIGDLWASRMPSIGFRKGIYDSYSVGSAPSKSLVI